MKCSDNVVPLNYDKINYKLPQVLYADAAGMIAESEE